MSKFLSIKFSTEAKYYLAHISSATIAFFSLPILTRIYDPETYGQFLLIISTLGLINTFFTQWIQQSIARFWPGYSDSDAEALNSQINSMTLFILFAVALVTLVTLPLVPELELTQTLMFLAITSGILAAANLIRASIHHALQDGTTFALFMFVQNASPPIFAVLFALYFEITLAALILSRVVASALAFVIVWHASVSWRHTSVSFGNTSHFARMEVKVIQKFAKYGGPLTAWVISAQLLNSLDHFMIAHYIDVGTAGVYATNYSLVISMQSFLFGPLLLAAHPRLMNLWNKNDPNYHSVLRQVVQNFGLLATLSMSFFLACYASLGEILMGADFRAGNGLMPLIALGHILWGLAAYLNKGFEFQQETWKMAALALAAGLVNFALNMLFIPAYGMEAAAYTTIASYALHLLATYYYSPKQIIVLPSRSLIALFFTIPCVLWFVRRTASDLFQSYSIENILLGGVVGSLMVMLAFVGMNGRRATLLRLIRAVRLQGDKNGA